MNHSAPRPLPRRSRHLAACVLASTLGVAAQGNTTGPYTANSFETHLLGTLPGHGFADGQDGWLLLEDIAAQANLAAVTVQTAVVRSGKQAVRWDASAMSPHAFGELRRNAMFSLTSGVIESEMDFLVTTSTNPSGAWEFYTQPTPHPASCQMRWGIGRNGLVYYYTTANRTIVQTAHAVGRDVWHHARTVVDVHGNRTEIWIDGTLVASGIPIGSIANLPDHGFTQINVVDAGNDVFHLDNFTVRERVAPHSLSVDLPRLPILQRSVVGVRLYGGTALAGRGYALAASLSGTSPGIQLGSVVLPLVPDAFLIAIANSLGTSALPGFLGNLGPQGTATATFDTGIAVPAALLGANLDFAYVALIPFDAVSEPVRVKVTL